MSSNDVSVVLAHGAWADGSSWSKVIRLSYGRWDQRRGRASHVLGEVIAAVRAHRAA
jgi:hypothetical protein